MAFMILLFRGMSSHMIMGENWMLIFNADLTGPWLLLVVGFSSLSLVVFRS